MKKVNQITKFIDKKVAEFEDAPTIHFKDIIKENWGPRKGVLELVGVYAIYEKNKGLIYVGSAGKGGHFMKYRMSDLFYFNAETNRFKHSLTEKLLTKIRRFKTISEIRSFYLKKCYIKVVETESIRKARILEDVLIELLSPKYNQE